MFFPQNFKMEDLQKTNPQKNFIVDVLETYHKKCFLGNIGIRKANHWLPMSLSIDKSLQEEFLLENCKQKQFEKNI